VLLLEGQNLKSLGNTNCKFRFVHFAAINFSCRFIFLEIFGLCPSPNEIRGVKSRKMRWTEHAARVGDRRGIYRVLTGRLRKRYHL